MVGAAVSSTCVGSMLTHYIIILYKLLQNIWFVPWWHLISIAFTHVPCSIERVVHASFCIRDLGCWQVVPKWQWKVLVCTNLELCFPCERHQQDLGMTCVISYQGFLSDSSPVKACCNILAVNTAHCFGSSNTVATLLMSRKGSTHAYWCVYYHAKVLLSYGPSQFGT